MYLGTKITKDIADLYQANFVPKLQNTNWDLKQWHTWFRHCNSLKKTILPRILSVAGFADAHAHNFPPTNYVQVSRISMVPKAAQVKISALNSFQGQSSKKWVAMERENTSIPLCDLFWMTSQPPFEMQTHPPIGNLIRVAQSVFYSPNLSPSISHITPIIVNLDFKPGFTNRNLRHLSTSGKFWLVDFWPTDDFPLRLTYLYALTRLWTVGALLSLDTIYRLLGNELNLQTLGKSDYWMQMVYYSPHTLIYSEAIL